MRYERKFAVDALDFGQIVNLVRVHPAQFREVYPPRFVNNIYLDTESLESYHDNVNGVMSRVKHRVRWYGESLGHVDEPRYEIKLKRGFVGDKLSFPLGSVSFDGQLTAREFIRRLENCTESIEMKEQIRRMRPTMFNRYRRLYFLSADRRYRITVDHEMSYGRFPPQRRAFFGEAQAKRTVVELKYAVEDDASAQLISAAFPFRLTKNSKYVTGVHSTWVGGF